MADETDEELRRILDDAPAKTADEVLARMDANLASGEKVGAIHVSKEAAQDMAKRFFGDDMPEEIADFFDLKEEDGG